MASQQDLAGLKDVTAKKYADQAKFFLNAFWVESGKDAELIWSYVQSFHKLDEKNGKEGHDLDEFWSHKFLETHGDTLTVIAMREALRQIDIDNNKRMSTIEYLLWKYKQSVKELLSRPQGTSEDLVKAQQALDDVQAEIAKIEAKKAELEEKAAGSGVKALNAKNELEQLLTKDNTALNKAVLTAEAAVRKAQKQGGTAQGSLWWLDRDLTEAKKYKPSKRQ